MGDLYELQYKHGSFHDFETGLTINREEQKEVEVDGVIGTATKVAIQNQRLLLVRTPKKAAKSGESKSGETK